MNQIRNYLERPKLYYNIDGVGELGLGIMCLGYALLAWLQLHAPQDSAWHKTYTFVIYLAVMISIIRYGSKAIKTRITYRRTGFVDYRPRDKYWIPIAAGAAFSALLWVALHVAARGHWEMQAPAVLVGLLFAAMYFRLARTVRWKWAVLCVVLAGVVGIAALPAELVETFANHTSLTSAIPAKAVGAYWLTFVAGGTVMMISGGISLCL